MNKIILIYCEDQICIDVLNFLTSYFNENLNFLNENNIEFITTKDIDQFDLPLQFHVDIFPAIHLVKNDDFRTELGFNVNQDMEEYLSNLLTFFSTPKSPGDNYAWNVEEKKWIKITRIEDTEYDPYDPFDIEHNPFKENNED